MQEVKEEIEINGVKNIIHYPNQPNKASLEQLYDFLNEVFKDDRELFYIHNEVEKMKQESSKIFI